MSVASPRITVYIPSYNYGRFLSNAIDSVLRQTYDDWELIIIDDSSSDNTLEVMNLYREHPQITLCSTDGIGLPSVCNVALKKAKGEYIIRLDGDDIFDENILLVLAKYLEQNLEAALVFPDYYLVDDFGKIFAHERRERIFEDNHMLDMPPNGACTLIRKAELDKLGGYREDIGAQDGLDIWTRLRDKYKCGNVNLPLFYYRQHGSNLTSNTNRILAARRQIKKDAIQENIKRSQPITAVIPCRRNYDFVTDLWSHKINGKTLLEKDIEVCLGSKLIDNIVVASDNLEAKEILLKFDDARLSFYVRDPKSTLRSTSILPTLTDIVQTFDPNLNGVTVLRYIQTPFVTTDTLEEAVTSLLMNEADSSCGVEALNTNLFRRSPHGLVALNNESKIYSDFDTIFRDSSTFMAMYNRNFSRGTLTGASIVHFEVSAAECFFINSKKDLKIAEILANGNA